MSNGESFHVKKGKEKEKHCVDGHENKITKFKFYYI
jgi:hypothetical protein